MSPTNGIERPVPALVPSMAGNGHGHLQSVQVSLQMSFQFLDVDNPFGVPCLTVGEGVDDAINTSRSAASTKACRWACWLYIL